MLKCSILSASIVSQNTDGKCFSFLNRSSCCKIIFFYHSLPIFFFSACLLGVVQTVFIFVMRSFTISMVLKFCISAGVVVVSCILFPLISLLSFYESMFLFSFMVTFCRLFGSNSTEWIRRGSTFLDSFYLA